MQEASTQELTAADRDLEKSLSIPEFVDELRRLADALEAGDLFEIDIEGEVIRVPVSAIASIEHEREDGREEIEFQLVWGSDEADEDEEGEGDSHSEGDVGAEIEPASEIA